MWIASCLDTVLKPTIAALGNFDGIHRGHHRVIQPILPQSGFFQRCLSQLTAGRVPELHSTVITFSPHPQEFFTGQPKALLTLPSEKATQLESLGVEQLILLPFNRELANLTPDQFVADLLVDFLQVKGVSVGQDFCFGKHRSGTAEDLQRLAAKFKVAVNIVPLQRDHCKSCNLDDRLGESKGDRISSSAIREALAQGDICRANGLLGYPYSLEGTVISGQQLGRQLGFPTANLQIAPHKFLPRSGVYAVKVEIPSPDGSAQLLPGVLNLGLRPTVGNNLEQTVEVHVLHWQGDLYGRSLRVYFHEFLRSEQKFDSLKALTDQIQADCQAAQTHLGAVQNLW